MVWRLIFCLIRDKKVSAKQALADLRKEYDI